jgi:uncharacterized protein YjiS (DUF1127 family)
MTDAQLTTAHPLSGWFFSILRAAVCMFRDWQARRVTLEILRSLDGRTLKDIGVHPNEIESLIYGERNDRRRRYDPNWRSDRAA